MTINISTSEQCHCNILTLTYSVCSWFKICKNNRYSWKFLTRLTYLLRIRINRFINNCFSKCYNSYKHDTGSQQGTLHFAKSSKSTVLLPSDFLYWCTQIYTQRETQVVRAARTWRGARVIILRWPNPVGARPFDDVAAKSPRRRYDFAPSSARRRFAVCPRQMRRAQTYTHIPPQGLKWRHAGKLPS